MTKKGVYQWIHQGTIPAYKLGATWIILRDELRDAIASGSNLAQELPSSLQADEEPEEDAD
jgi:excisionase family DNA binding protein